MYLIQLLLPLYDNGKIPFPRKQFDEVRGVLTERFGGVTAYQRSPAVGLWKESGSDEADVSRDDVIMIEVMTDELEEKWWKAYRVELEKIFRQEELVIR